MQNQLEIEQRSFIKSCVALKESVPAIHLKLIQVHGEAAYSSRTVRRWYVFFVAGGTRIEDQPRPGRPITETNSANIQLIEKIINEDPRVSYSYLEDTTRLSRGTLQTIIKDKLGLRKKAARWIPYFLSEKNKRARFEFATAMLKKINDGEWRLDQILTGDECIFYHRKIDKRQSASTWQKPGERPAVLVRRSHYEPKTMVVVFFRSTGLVHIHGVPEKQTINNAYYIENCLSPAFEALKQQRKKSGLRGIKLLTDNATPHTNFNTRSFVQSNGVVEIDHPPYSPDLAPCDYWLFDYIKQQLSREEDEETIVNSITKIVKNIPHKEFIKTFKKYIERLELCVKAEGDYFEPYMK